MNELHYQLLICAGIIAVWDLWQIAGYSKHARLGVPALIALLVVFALNPLWLAFRVIIAILEGDFSIPNPLYKKDKIQ